MENVKHDFVNLLPIQSRNAFLNFINGARNLGKTWAGKTRSFKRYLRRGKKTVWVRRFKKEAQKTKIGFYSKKLCKKLGVNVDDFRINGDWVQYKRGDKWESFIEIVALSDRTAHRSVDDPDVDTIIFDEYTTTPEKYRQYRGDECTDFADLLFSKKRAGNVTVFFFGNKEAIINPYFSYFGLPEIESDFVGIRTFKNGSIALQVIDDVPDEIQSSYDGKVADAFAGTAYYSYLTEGANKQGSTQIRKKPKNVTRLCQFDFCGVGCTVYRDRTKIYIASGIDKNRTVYCDIPRRYQRTRIVTARERFLFAFIVDAYKRNELYYDTQNAFANSVAFIKYIVTP